MIHVKYHKGLQQTSQHKENVRFVPHPVGELVFNDLIYIMPPPQFFLRQQIPKALLSAFIWEDDGKVWTDGKLSRCLEDASIQAGTLGLHIANRWQMTIAVVKTKCASQIRQFEANDEDEDAQRMEDDARMRPGSAITRRLFISLRLL